VSDALSVRAATHGLLRDLGMTTVFGNPGSTELRFFDGLPPDFRYVLALQESSAVAMADGFAQATRRAAFVNLHSAVGVGHALGSVFTAMRNATPLVLTAGQQTRAMLPTEPFLFAEDAAAFPKPYVKWSVEPARAEDVPAAIARAHHMAVTPPAGPVLVSVPEDDWEIETEPVVVRHVATEFVGDPDALAAVARALGRSERPALVVGPGVDRDGAGAEVVALAERLGAAVWVSPLSGRCSFPEDHPAFAGFLTPQRARLRQQLAPYDVVVVLGAPAFTYHVPGEGPVVADGTTLFQLVDDPAMAAWAPAGTAVLTTLRRGVDRLLAELPAPVGPRSAAGRGPRPDVAPATPLSAAYVLHLLAGLLPPDAVVVEEAPSHRNALHEHLPIRRVGGFAAAASGGLGWALPAAVGWALADPGRRVVCLVGDGSSLYSIQALWTAAQLALPLTVLVLNNGGYGALKALGRAIGIDRPPGVDLPGLDLVAVARGFGCEAGRVTEATALPDVLRGVLAHTGPTLVDIAVDAAVERLY
jgi:benzoylformate decarboxylase